MVNSIGGAPQPNPVPERDSVPSQQKEKWLSEISAIMQLFESGQDGQAITHLDSLIVKLEGYKPPSKSLDDAVNNLDAALSSIEHGQTKNVVAMLDRAYNDITHA